VSEARATSREFATSTSTSVVGVRPITKSGHVLQYLPGAEKEKLSRVFTTRCPSGLRVGWTLYRAGGLAMKRGGARRLPHRGPSERRRQSRARRGSLRREA